MTQLPFADDWRIEADDADEPVLVGTRAGRLFRSRPVATLDLASHTARLVDGTMLHLGQPAERADLACGDAVDPLRLQQIVDRAGRDTQDLGLLYDRRQHLLGDPPALEKAREVRAIPQLRDAQLDRAGAGVAASTAVAIALSVPLGTLLGLAGAGAFAHLQLQHSFRG